MLSPGTAATRYPGFCKELVVLAARVRHAGHVLVSACRDVVRASARMVTRRAVTAPRAQASNILAAQEHNQIYRPSNDP
jgi:hypothetical protein